MRKRRRDAFDFVRCDDPSRRQLGFRSGCSGSCCIKSAIAFDDPCASGDSADKDEPSPPPPPPPPAAPTPRTTTLAPKYRLSLCDSPAGEPPPALWKETRSSGNHGPNGTLMKALRRTYPLGRDSLHDEVAEKLRQCEKYEIALQGDDWQDKEHQDTNSEALTYAKGAAMVVGLEYSLSELCSQCSKSVAIAKLREEPFIGEATAIKIYDLVTTPDRSCKQLRLLENNERPVHSDGTARVLTKSKSRSMLGAYDKHQLKKIVGLSAIRASKIWEGGYNGVPSVKTIAAMRELPVKAPPGVPSLELLMKRMDDEPSSVVPLKLQQQAAANAAASSSSPNKPQDAYGYSRSSFKFGLDHHEELEEPIPAYEAEKMRYRVLKIVREQQGCWPGCQCTCTLRAESRSSSTAMVAGSSSGSSSEKQAAVCKACVGCDCCWHFEFVGGAPRRGRVGNDVDLLIHHKTKPAWDGSVDEYDRANTVLKRLVRQLEDEDYLVSQRDGWQMPTYKHRSRMVKTPDGGWRPTNAHRKDISAYGETSHGFENLSQDLHDKVFGIWKSKQPDGTVKHRRIDIVVCSYPEEYALCRLAWTGSRLFNRLLRHHCLNSGLYLTAHALLVRQSNKPLIIKDNTTGEVLRVPKKGEAGLAEVPYEFLQTEEDILFLLGGCSEAFYGLCDPRNRNL